MSLRLRLKSRLYFVVFIWISKCYGRFLFSAFPDHTPLHEIVSFETFNLAADKYCETFQSELVDEEIKSRLNIGNSRIEDKEYSPVSDYIPQNPIIFRILKIPVSSRPFNFYMTCGRPLLGRGSPTPIARWTTLSVGNCKAKADIARAWRPIRLEIFFLHQFITFHSHLAFHGSTRNARANARWRARLATLFKAPNARDLFLILSLIWWA